MADVGLGTRRRASSEWRAGVDSAGGLGVAPVAASAGDGLGAHDDGVVPPRWGLWPSGGPAGDRGVRSAGQDDDGDGDFGQAGAAVVSGLFGAVAQALVPGKDCRTCGCEHPPPGHEHLAGADRAGADRAPARVRTLDGACLPAALDDVSVVGGQDDGAAVNGCGVEQRAQMLHGVLGPSRPTWVSLGQGVVDGVEHDGDSPLPLRAQCFDEGCWQECSTGGAQVVLVEDA